MKLVAREYVTDYATYSFGYCNWAIREPGDALCDIYSGGYLPYSADLSDSDSFYMARSLRVRLADFTPSSENRRVLRKFDGNVTATITALADFADAGFEAFALDYFAREHGQAMPPERLRHIMQMQVVSHVVQYRDGAGAALGYVLLAADETFAHYWFSFYAESLARQSFGMYMMLDCARRGKETGQQHFYLGTGYGASGRYKLNFPATDYWTGSAWSGDIARLKTLLAAEEAAKAEALAG